MIKKRQKPPEEWYLHINDIVAEFQAGDKTAGELLLAYFKPVTTKYFMMLREGRPYFEDKDARDFVSLYVSDAHIRKQIAWRKRPDKANEEIVRVVKILQRSLQFVPAEDLDQELMEIILFLAKKYRKIGPVNFNGFLSVNFKYQVATRVKRLTNDAATRFYHLQCSYDDSMNIEEFENIQDTGMVENPLPDIDDNEIGTNWVQGFTAGEMFDHLTPMERLILKMSYVDGYFDVEICKKLSMHRNSIGNKRRGAIKKIEERMKEIEREDR